MVAQRIDESIKNLGIRWQWRPSILTGVGFAKEKVWSRAARRRQRSLGSQSGDTKKEVDDEDEDDDDAALAFKVQVTQSKEAGNVVVVIRWLKGHDAVLFESFCGMLKRLVESKQ